MRHIIVLDLLTNTGKQDDGNCKSDGDTDTVDNALDEIVALLHVRKCNTENRTVGGN